MLFGSDGAVLSYETIEVIHNDVGVPEVRMHGAAVFPATIALSLSHTRDTAIAFVIALPYGKHETDPR
jgi:phosphopantetheinyl transferase (holo-ACP synthase)